MPFTVLDPKFKRHLRRYLLQVLLATVSLAGVLWAEDLLAGSAAARAVLVAAIASTAFILFISPHSDTAGASHAIGGHLWALLIASLLAVAIDSSWGRQYVTDMPMVFALYAAVGVGLTMLAMALRTPSIHLPPERPWVSSRMGSTGS